uniref:Uncharacterized protein n=1 Tax=Romanomermis culicivorax TaxID=13658 RepID=A0A915I7R6_ROMCU
MRPFLTEKKEKWMMMKNFKESTANVIRFMDQSFVGLNKLLQLISCYSIQSNIYVPHQFNRIRREFGKNR